MKKLMAIIGAVAMAFGLQATTLTNTAISFEPAETGCSGETFDWSTAGLWSTDYDDVFKFGTFDGDAYAYPSTGANARRDSSFVAADINNKYLKLSTGTNSLNRLFSNSGAVDPSPVFIDQVIKFTGFEEVQSNFVAGTKIALWLEAIEDDEDTAEVNEATTNLYAAVGQVSGGGVTLKNVKIEGTYEVDKWYRLTIRSIGNIMGEGILPASLNGFAIYIDGAPVSIVAEDRANLIDVYIGLVPKARALYDNGQLFPSMDASSTTLTSVGYQGMGAIDDLIVDNIGPEFAQIVDFRIAGITGASVVSVSNLTDGVELTADPSTGMFSVVPGTLVGVQFTHNGPYVLSPDPLAATKTVSVGDTLLDFSQSVTPEAAAASVNGVDYYTTIDAAFAAAVNDGDFVTVLIEGEYYPYGSTGIGIDYAYTFVTNTEIVIVDDPAGYEVAVPDAADMYMESTFGVETGKTVHVYGDMNLMGAIPSTSALWVDGSGLNELTGKATLVDDLLVEGEFIADELDVDVYTITLAGDGCVKTKSGTLISDGAFSNDPSTLSVAGPDLDGFYTYEIASSASVDFTLDIPEHTTIASVSGATWDAGKSAYTAEAGATVTVTLSAEENYAFAGGATTATTTVTAAAGSVLVDVAAPTLTPFVENTTTQVQYTDLQAAIAAAADGETLRLIASHTHKWGNGVAFETVSGRHVTLDLNGQTLTGIATNVASGAERKMFHVRKGDEFTITDTSVGAPAGKIHFREECPSSFSYGSYAVVNEGTFNLSAGTIEATGDYKQKLYGEPCWGIVYVLENRVNSAVGDVVFNMTGGTLDIVQQGPMIEDPDNPGVYFPTRNGITAVRVYGQDATGTNVINITGGTLGHGAFSSSLRNGGNCKSRIYVANARLEGRMDFQSSGESTVDIVNCVIDNEMAGAAFVEPWIRAQAVGSTTFVEPFVTIDADTASASKLRFWQQSAANAIQITGGLFDESAKITYVDTPYYYGGGDNGSDFHAMSDWVPEWCSITGEGPYLVEPTSVRFTVGKDVGVVSATYTVNGVAGTLYTTNDVVCGDEIEITGVVYDDGYEAAGTYVNGYSYTITAADVAAGTLIDWTIASQLRFTLVPPAHATVTSVSGATWDSTAENYIAAPGAEISVTLTADSGYVFDGGATTAVETFTATPGSIQLGTAPNIEYVQNTTTLMKYTDLQVAIDAAASGETLQLIADYEFEWNNKARPAGITVNRAGVPVTLDLNGKMFYGIAPSNNWSYLVNIAEGSTFTIKDTSVGGTGSFRALAKNPDSNYGYGNYCVNNCGTFNLEGGTVSMASEGDAGIIYTVENHLNYTTASVYFNMSGGRLVTDPDLGAGIRIYCNGNASSTGTNYVNISGGEITEWPFSNWAQPGTQIGSRVNITGGKISIGPIAIANTGNTEIHISGDAEIDTSYYEETLGSSYSYFKLNNDHAGSLTVTEPYAFINTGTSTTNKLRFSQAFAAGISPSALQITGGLFDEKYEHYYSKDDKYDVYALTNFVPAWCRVTDVTPSGPYLVEPIPVDLTVAKDAGVSALTFTVNGTAGEVGVATPVVYGDVIEVTSVSYGGGYSARGTVVEGYTHTVTAEDIASGALSLTALSTATFTLATPGNTTVTSVTGATAVETSYTADTGAEVQVILLADAGYQFAGGDTESTNTFAAAAGEISVGVAPTKITVNLTVTKDAGVAAAAFTVNGDAGTLDTPVAVGIGDVITITSVTYNSGYAASGTYVQGYTYTIVVADLDADISWTIASATSDPVTPVDPSLTPAQQAAAATNSLQAAGFPAGDAIYDTVTSSADIAALNTLLKANGVEAMSDVTAAQLANMNDSFLMKDITGNRLFTGPARIDVISMEETATEGTWQFTVGVVDGSTDVAITTAAAAQALAGKALKGTVLGTWTSITAADIQTAEATAGGDVTFTVAFGNGTTGFMKINVTK